MENIRNIRQLGLYSSQDKSAGVIVPSGIIVEWCLSTPEVAFDHPYSVGEQLNSHILPLPLACSSWPPALLPLAVHWFSFQMGDTEMESAPGCGIRTPARDVGGLESLMLQGPNRSGFLRMRDGDCEV